MILQIDVGNTRIHWRRVQNGSPSTQVVCSQGHVAHGPLPAQALEQPIAAVELACVAGDEVRDMIKRDLADRAGLPVFEARSDKAACGIRNSYADPQRMGVDRWLAMIGAFNEYPGGVIIVDAGTAVTVDYVSPDGAHLGGYILPGLHLMLDALGGHTAKVRMRAGDVGSVGPGHSTTECVNHGLAWLWSSAVERLQQDQQAYELQTIVVTGGDAGFFKDLLGAQAVVEPDLIFMGMDRVFAGTEFRSGLRD